MRSPFAVDNCVARILFRTMARAGDAAGPGSGGRRRARSLVCPTVRTGDIADIARHREIADMLSMRVFQPWDSNAPAPVRALRGRTVSVKPRDVATAALTIAPRISERDASGHISDHRPFSTSQKLSISIKHSPLAFIHNTRPSRSMSLTQSVLCSSTAASVSAVKSACDNMAILPIGTRFDCSNTKRSSAKFCRPLSASRSGRNPELATDCIAYAFSDYPISAHPACHKNTVAKCY